MAQEVADHSALPCGDPSEQTATALHPSGIAVERALRQASYEVLPLRTAEESIIGAVPRDVSLTVTMTASKGVEPTIDLTERLVAHGYLVTPHLAARMFRDRAHLADTIARLRDNGVTGAFVIAGDVAGPHGPFTDALSLIGQLETIDHQFRQLGIGGYPEGHADLDNSLIDRALHRKADHATHLITQLCFNPATTTAWARRVKSDGVHLPIRVGLPGAVTRQKLVRISAGLGLGQSARFLRKQQNLFWRFFLPGGYQPDRLVQALAPRIGAADHALAGFHFFTFNEVARTEAWRQTWLRRLENNDPDDRRARH